MIRTSRIKPILHIVLPLILHLLLPILVFFDLLVVVEVDEVVHVLLVDILEVLFVDFEHVRLVLMVIKIGFFLAEDSNPPQFLRLIISQLYLAVVVARLRQA